VTPAQGLPARAAAQAILHEVLHKRRPLDATLEAAGHLEPRDQGFARAIASETLRRFGQLDALVRSFVAKLPPPHRAGPTFEILLAGACELLFLGVAPHAAVDAANRLAQTDQKAVHFKALINAVLRRIAREGKAAIEAQDAARLDTPDWLWTRWCDAYGEETARKIAEAHLKPAAVDVVLKPGTAASERPEGEILFGDVLRVTSDAPVESLPGFAGNWWVQDAAASLPALLFGEVKGLAVIDLCAAPGGKTMQLAQMGARVTAVERDGERLKRVRGNLERMKLEATLVNKDARDFRPDAPAPFVFLDAPCTATGTIRRHPELPWIKGASDVTLLSGLQGELIDAAAEMTSAEGLLIYAVCSLEPEEGVEQVETFLARNDAFARAAISPSELFGMSELITEAGDLRTLPCHLADKGGMDGFYAARLRRRV
jgi:16S rRNA (cytosine967-C5)-methyltransferase